MAKLVVGMFDNMEHARDAVNELVDNGIDRNAISLIASDERGEMRQYIGQHDETGSEISDSAAAGAGVGAALGGIGGLLMGLGALAIPGFGPVIAAGPIVTALGGAGMGAAAGAVAGGLLGALVEMGIPDERARLYQEGIRRGHILVTIRINDEQANTAVSVLNRHHPVDVDRKSTEWGQFYQEGAATTSGSEAMGGYTNAISQDTPGVQSGQRAYGMHQGEDMSGQTGTAAQRDYGNLESQSRSDYDDTRRDPGSQAATTGTQRDYGAGSDLNRDLSAGHTDDLGGYSSGSYSDQDASRGRDLAQDRSHGEDQAQNIDYGQGPNQDVNYRQDLAQDMSRGEDQAQHIDYGQGRDQQIEHGKDLAQNMSRGEDQVQDMGHGDAAGAQRDFGASRGSDLGDELSGNAGLGRDYGSQHDYDKGDSPGDLGMQGSRGMGAGTPQDPSGSSDLGQGTPQHFGSSSQTGYDTNPDDLDARTSPERSASGASLGDARYSEGTGFQSGYDANPDDLDTMRRSAHPDDTTNFGDRAYQRDEGRPGQSGDQPRDYGTGSDFSGSSFSDRSYSGEDYQSHYDFGAHLHDDPSYQGRMWDDIELDVRHKWENANRDTPWDRIKDAIRRGWESVTGRTD